MANGEYKLVKVNASNTLDEKTIQAVSGKVLGFDSNLDPSMVDAGGGGLTWIAKTTTYTAVKNEGILANTSSASWTLTLPTSPTAGDTVGITDANGTFGTNNLTIERNGQKIQGLEENLVVDMNNASFLLIYSGTTTGWKLDTYLPNSSEGVVYGTEITAAANLTRSGHNFKTTMYNRATAADLTLQLADWQRGDWCVIRQIGAGQATIVAQNTNVKLPTWKKTAGVNFDMYIECYLVDGSDKYFHITGGIS